MFLITPNLEFWKQEKLLSHHFHITSAKCKNCSWQTMHVGPSLPLSHLGDALTCNIWKPACAANPQRHSSLWLLLSSVCHLLHKGLLLPTYLPCLQVWWCHWFGPTLCTQSILPLLLSTVQKSFLFLWWKVRQAYIVAVTFCPMILLNNVRAELDLRIKQMQTPVTLITLMPPLISSELCKWNALFAFRIQIAWSFLSCNWGT